MKQTIIQKLAALELEFDVKILLAIESGSRAWGFASPDSDFDVRFIYVHKRDFYLSIDDPRDVIELPINDVLDINGWELRKALRLFRKSNAPLYEWLQSPVVYRVDATFIEEIKSLMPLYFSPRASMHHYLSMAKGVFESDLSGAEVRLKKYFYALRPILACRWIADRAEVPPMEFSKLRFLMHKELVPVVDNLLKQKAVENEKFMTPRINSLHDYLKAEIRYCEKAVPEPEAAVKDNERLNELFRKYSI